MFFDEYLINLRMELTFSFFGWDFLQTKVEENVLDFTVLHNMYE